MTRPNNVTTDYTYDNLSRLLSVLHKLSGSTIDGASYTVDAVGNRTAKVNQLPSGPTENYTYDNIYQLTQVAQAGPTTTESYTYDAVGNRTASLSASPWSYNSSNHLTAIGSGPNTTFTYDNNGNTLTKVDSSGTTSYTWDYENRLASVTLPNSGGTVSFTYDPLGRRIRKVFGSATIIYAYDGENIVEETDASGTAVARYAMGLSIDEPLAMLRSSATHYYSADGLGSVTSLTDGSGTVAASYTYDTFGNLAASTGSVTNPLRYTAREWDSATGLYFYRLRYYGPAIGRFLSEDPLWSPQTAFAYVGNNPMNYVDPFGLARVKVCLNTMKLVLSDNKGNVLFCPDIQAVGCEVSPTPLGKYKLGDWEKDKTSKKWGRGSADKWSETWTGFNVFGAYFVPVWNTGGVGIHGRLGDGALTESIYHWFKPCSAGCIRLTNEDIAKLREKLPKPAGTPVEITDNCTGKECGTPALRPSRGVHK
jgi:RHS repeat-associated protein